MSVCSNAPFYREPQCFETKIEKYVYKKKVLVLGLNYSKYDMNLIKSGDHGGRVVTLSPPTSEAGVRFPARPQVGKLVVACRWSAVYSTEP